MSLIKEKHKKKKRKYPRSNHRDYHKTRFNKKKRRKLRESGWKLQYPEFFEITDKIPFIVKKTL